MDDDCDNKGPDTVKHLHYNISIELSVYKYEIQPDKYLPPIAASHCFTIKLCNTNMRFKV